jgi:hypothetical protein
VTRREYLVGHLGGRGDGRARDHFPSHKFILIASLSLVGILFGKGSPTLSHPWDMNPNSLVKATLGVSFREDFLFGIHTHPRPRTKPLRDSIEPKPSDLRVCIPLQPTLRRDQSMKRPHRTRRQLMSKKAADCVGLTACL